MMHEKRCDGCGHVIEHRAKSLTVSYMTTGQYELCMYCGLGIIVQLSRLGLLSHRIRTNKGKGLNGAPIR